MFGKKTAKKAEEAARLQQQKADQRLDQALAPKPVETEVDRQNLGWLKMWDNVQDEGEIAPDILKAPGFGLQAAAFNADLAADNQAEEKQGRGLISMGLNSGGNVGLSQLLNQQSKDRRAQERGLTIQRAAAMKDAEVRGSIIPLLGLQTSRGLSGAGLSSQAAIEAQRRADELQRRSGFGQTAFGRAFLGSAGSFLGGGASGYSRPNFG